MAYPSLSPLVEQGLLDEILDNLGFIHANDHCRRNCTHCPAFGDTSPVQMTPFATLTRLVRDVGEAFRDRGISPSAASSPGGSATRSTTTSGTARPRGTPSTSPGSGVNTWGRDSTW